MITSPLIPQEHYGRNIPKLSSTFAFFTILLLTAAIIQSFVQIKPTRAEIAVGTDFPFFDTYIKNSDWWNGMCKKGCKGDEHKCGLAQDSFEEIIGKANINDYVIKRYQALHDGDNYQQKPYVRPTGNANQAPTDTQAVIAMATAASNAMFQAIGNNNGLINVAIKPDHTFMLEANEGKYRLYQSWIDTFTLRYWLGEGWKAFTQGPCWGNLDKSVQRSIGAARGRYGMYAEFDVNVAKSMVAAAISQMAIKLDDNGELDYSGATSTVPLYGKEATIGHKNTLESITIAKRGVQVAFGYFLMPEPEPEPEPEQNLQPEQQVQPQKKKSD